TPMALATSSGSRSTVAATPKEGVGIPVPKTTPPWITNQLRSRPGNPSASCQVPATSKAAVRDGAGAQPIVNMPLIAISERGVEPEAGSSSLAEALKPKLEVEIRSTSCDIDRRVTLSGEQSAAHDS